MEKQRRTPLAATLPRCPSDRQNAGRSSVGGACPRAGLLRLARTAEVVLACCVMTNRRERLGAVLVVASICAAWLVAACGPGKGAASPTPAPGSSAPLVAVPSDATPIHVEFIEGGCRVVADDSPGGSYKTAPGQEQALAKAMEAALRPCFSAGGGRHGLAHVRALAHADGSLSDVMVAPGGALSNEVESCLAKSVSQTKLPGASSADAVLLVMVTSTCSER